MRRIFQKVQILWIVFALVSVAQAQSPAQVDFARDIQPILSENCYYCHGQDAEQRQAGLRLDVREDALAVIKTGDHFNSEIINRLTSTDEGDMMPPPDSNRSVSKEEIELIKRWIDEGANWATHWAFRPVIKPGLASDAAIDELIKRKLEANGLSLSEKPDRNTLIRRVAIDLTGLPPTTEELKQFLDDKSPEAYSKMVDRYLDSPAYGERMAWVWLNAARYADSNGYQGDNERTMWPWRDWVVKAYNDNLPFDEFSKWQLAGDLYPNATLQQQLATAFNRNHPINGEGGRIAEENRIDYVMDMAETTGTIWMGLTFNCCRCHDHKYDQLTQEDYYSLFAFFNQTPVKGGEKSGQTEPTLMVPSERQSERMASYRAELTKIEEATSLRKKELIKSLAQWEREQLANLESNSHWKVLKPIEYSATNSQIKALDDDSLLTFGPNPVNDDYVVQGKTGLETIQAVRLEALPHDSMTNNGLTRAASSNFVLTDFRVLIVEPESEPVELTFVSAIADYEQGTHDVFKAFDDNPKSGWAVYRKDKKMGQPREAVFHFDRPVTISKQGSVKVVLKHQSPHQNHNLGRFRISFSQRSKPELAGTDYAFFEAIEIDSKERSPEQEKIVLERFYQQDKTLVSLGRQRTREEQNLNAITKNLPRVMVMKERSEYRKSFLLNRGSYQEPRNEVSARIPEMLGSLPEAEHQNRKALSEWLFDESNPLTARVTVNRLWAQVFGIGLVKTTEDFGVQGEPPTHPELLDWLAAEYRDSGWDTKHVLRLILNSQTYQQTSKTNPKLLEADPENRLLARSPRYRMPSWMLRDYALAASGRMVRDMGGPPVNTYQPAGVWEEASFGKKKFKLDSGDSLYRRSLYTFWRRIAAPTMFFDNADRMTCSVKRYLTNTPLHALNTLNDETFVEAARLLATDVMQREQDDRARLNLIFQRVVSRLPDDMEAAVLLAGLDRSKNQFSDKADTAAAFIGIGESKPNENLDPVELASWSSLCLAVLNLDEALTRQ